MAPPERATLERIQETLWPLQDPEREWSPDTLDAIAMIMEEGGYGKRPHPRSDVSVLVGELTAILDEDENGHPWDGEAGRIAHAVRVMLEGVDAGT